MTRSTKPSRASRLARTAAEPLTRLRLPAFVGPAAMGLGFLIVVMLAGGSLWLIERSRVTSAWVDHSYAVRLAISRTRGNLQASESARRGFLLDQDPILDGAYRDAAALLPQRLGELRALVDDNPTQLARVTQFSTLLQEHQNAQATSMVGVRVGARAPAVARFARDGSSARIEALEGLLSHMVREEEALLAQRTREEAEAQRLLYLMTVAGVALIALLGLLSIAAYARNAAALERSRDELRHFNEDLERAVAERTSDLEQANSEIQRFAHLVSHDLRAPLVNIMGFNNELRRVRETLKAEGHTESSDSDMTEAIHFIHTSTEKMDRLITSILRMAREGRRTLQPQEIDMNALVAEQFDSHRSRAQERAVTLEMDGALPGILSDRLAVEQVFANLVDNAIKYSKRDAPGRVVVRGREDRGWLQYEVEDEGVGVGPRDQHRIFDMFRRAGGEDEPGEGVGLAYVRQITRRLGGTISLKSEPGKGSVFRVTLPRRLIVPARERAREQA